MDLPQQIQSQTMSPVGGPQGMPQIQGGGMDNQPITDEQKKELLDIIQEIRSKIGTVSAMDVASKAKTEIERKKLLKEVFDQMQMAGVDLSNRESVSSFMDKLKQGNPELADIFEKSMDILLGAPDEMPLTDPQMPGGMPDPMAGAPQNNMNMNPNENVPQG